MYTFPLEINQKSHVPSEPKKPADLFIFLSSKESKEENKKEENSDLYYEINVSTEDGSNKKHIVKFSDVVQYLDSINRTVYTADANNDYTIPTKIEGDLIKYFESQLLLKDIADRHYPSPNGYDIIVTIYNKLGTVLIHDWERKILDMSKYKNLRSVNIYDWN